MGVGAVATSLFGSFSGTEGADRSTRVYKKETKFGNVNTSSKEKALVSNNIIYIVVIAIVSALFFLRK